ncbi:MAG: hypothetical protein ABSF33_19605 [Acidimicrobiales bacterium]
MQEKEKWPWPEGKYFVRLPHDLPDKVGYDAFRFWRFVAKTAGADPLAWPRQKMIQAGTGLSPKVQHRVARELSNTYDDCGAYLEVIEWARDDNSKTSNVYVLYPFARQIPDEVITRLRGWGHRFYARPKDPPTPKQIGKSDEQLKAQIAKAQADFEYWEFVQAHWDEWVAGDLKIPEDLRQPELAYAS